MKIIKNILCFFGYGLLGALITFIPILAIFVPLDVYGIYKIPEVSGKLFPFDLNQFFKDIFTAWPIVVSYFVFVFISSHIINKIQGKKRVAKIQAPLFRNKTGENRD